MEVNHINQEGGGCPILSYPAIDDINCLDFAGGFAVPCTFQDSRYF